MKNRELISMVVPCYNVESYVKKCIQSIKKQTYQNIEVFMIDDGSKDNTKKVIKEEIKGDKRFKYYYKKNGGLSDARNYGLQYIHGKYVCFIDSDDWLDQDYVKELYHAIISGDYSISICGYKMAFQDKVVDCLITKSDIDNFITPNAWNKLYKTELFKDIQFPVGKWYEDLGTFPKLYMIDSNYTIVDKPLYYYRQNSNSIMNTVDDRIFHAYDVIEGVEEFAKSHKLFKKYYSNLEMMNIYHLLISTSYRASYYEKFNKKMLKDIKTSVEGKYPLWYKNKRIKDCCSLTYILYLKLYKWGFYHIMMMILFFMKNRKINRW